MKDMASGAVLVGAVFAVCVAVCLFWKPEGFVRMGAYFGFTSGYDCLCWRL